LIAAFLILPCALLGAAFPLATALLQRRDPGHAAGVAYAVNTVGTIAGSLVAGFYAIPTWGAQATHVFTLCLAGAIGLAATWLAHARREVGVRNLSLACATLVAVVALACVAPKWEPGLMSLGVFRPVQALSAARAAESLPGKESVVRRVAKSERTLYYAEGINGSVLVGTRGNGRERWLRVGGKVDASVGRDMETQVMLGLIPAACADSGGRTLVIGLGAGFTLSAVLAAGAGPTEVVELEPRVVDASRFFHAAGQHPLDDPRVHLVLGDARTCLAHGDGEYGVIVSEPSNPWIAGVNNLFTVDFYRRVRSRLEPRGVFCQWVQLYELSPGTLASMLASFLEVFPEGQAYRMCRGADLLLVSTPKDCRFALERLRTPESRRLLERVGIRSPNGVAGYYVGPLSGLRDLAAGAHLNSDDLPVVEYWAPRDLVTVGRAVVLTNPLPRNKVPAADTPPEGPLFSAWSREDWFESRVGMLVDQGDMGGAAAAARAASSAGLTRLGRRLSEEVDAEMRREQATEQAMRARQLFDDGRDEQGMQALLQAAETDPNNGRLWLWIADRRRLAKDFAGAERDLARGRATGDAGIEVDAALIAGMLEVDRSQPMTAAKRFREVQRLSPLRADGYLYEACARAAGGDSTGARDAVRRGLERLPGEQRLSALLGTLE
jgi:spermidine synthase